jgi:hypothetical protein
MYNSIIENVKALAGNEFLYFDKPLKVTEGSQVIPPVNIWAVSVDPNDIIYVMDADEQWYKVEKSDVVVIVPLHRKIDKMVFERQYRQAI